MPYLTEKKEKYQTNPITGLLKHIVLKSLLIFKAIGDLSRLLLPLSLLLISVFGAKLIWNISFTEFIELIKVLIWPVTALITLFFFREVTTYLFFSMNEFNFFGLKGNLRNVRDVISEEVLKIKKAEKREKENQRLKLSYQKQIDKTNGTAQEYKELAEKVIESWKKSDKTKAVIINNLKRENKLMRETISREPAENSPPPESVNSPEGSGDKIDVGEPIA